MIRNVDMRHLGLWKLEKEVLEVACAHFECYDFHICFVPSGTNGKANIIVEFVN